MIPTPYTKRKSKRSFFHRQLVAEPRHFLAEYEHENGVLRLNIKKALPYSNREGPSRAFKLFQKG